MRDFQQMIEQLAVRWDYPTAQAIVGDLTTAVWQAGRPDGRTKTWADRLRRLLRDRLAGEAPPAEQLPLLNMLYSLEQGMGNRDRALALAEQVEALAGTFGQPLDHVRAAFQLAKALLYVDRNTEAVNWSARGLRLGDEVDRTASLTPDERTCLRRMLADQESRLANRMAMSGGRNEEVDRAIESVLKRWAALDDPTGFAAALGMLVEARVFQGRWTEAVDLARQALAAVDYPANQDSGIAYALCFGALALCRLGDHETALKWTADAGEISRQIGNHECVLESRAVHAVALAGTGQVDEAMARLDAIIVESGVVNMTVLTHWVASLRAWIRLAAGRPTPSAESLEASAYMSAHGYNVMGAEMLYQAACALDQAAREFSTELIEAIALFRRYGMSWHLALAGEGETRLRVPRL